MLKYIRNFTKYNDIIFQRKETQGHLIFRKLLDYFSWWPFDLLQGLSDLFWIWNSLSDILVFWNTRCPATIMLSTKSKCFTEGNLSCESDVKLNNQMIKANYLCFLKITAYDMLFNLSLLPVFCVRKCPLCVKFSH